MTCPHCECDVREFRAWNVVVHLRQQSGADHSLCERGSGNSAGYRGAVGGDRREAGVRYCRHTVPLRTEPVPGAPLLRNYCPACREKENDNGKEDR